MRTRHLLFLSGFCLALSSLTFAAETKPVFRAGAATSNITPPIGADPKIRTSRPPATHVHDELHARCLVLDDGQAKLALVVCDLRHISAEVAAGAKQIIEKMTGIPPHCVVISATHTHTSGGAKLEQREGEPYYDYIAYLTRRIAEGVLRAHNQLEPAQIGWASSRSRRRSSTADGSWCPAALRCMARMTTSSWSIRILATKACLSLRVLLIRRSPSFR